MEGLLGRFSRDVAIDLGTATTRIYVQGRGMVLEEPTAVASRSTEDGVEVIAVGEEAAQMAGRSPEGVEVCFPVREGVVRDFRLAEDLLRRLIQKSMGRNLVRPRAVTTVPASMTEVERRAIGDSLRAVGFRDVRLLPRAAVAAIGADLPVWDPLGSMIVDIGAGRTEIAVLSLGGVAACLSLPIGGDQMDAALAGLLRDRHDLEVGRRSAEAAKRLISLDTPLSGDAAVSIKGRELRTGRPTEVAIEPRDVATALESVITQLREGMRAVLSDTPPELAGDVLGHGVVLCGGTSLLRGLDKALRAGTGLPMVVVEAPLHCVIGGLGTTLENPALLDRLAL